MLFSNGFLYKYQIENIHKIAREMLKVFKGENLATLDKYIESVFKIWQFERGRKPNNIFTGLLCNKHEQNKDEPLTVEEFEQFNPWQCAGIGINNDIDLAFHLWVEDYDKFKELLKNYRMERILAVLLLKTEDTAHSNSIFKAYNYILDTKLWKLEATLEATVEWFTHDKNKYKERELKKSEQLALARKVAASKKTEKSNKYKAEWELWAYETLRVNPYWNLDQVATHVQFVAERKNHAMANGQPYKFSYIRNSIKGFKGRLRMSDHKNA